MIKPSVTANVAALAGRQSLGVAGRGAEQAAKVAAHSGGAAAVTSRPRFPAFVAPPSGLPVKPIHGARCDFQQGKDEAGDDERDTVAGHVRKAHRVRFHDEPGGNDSGGSGGESSAGNQSDQQSGGGSRGGGGGGGDGENRNSAAPRPSSVSEESEAGLVLSRLLGERDSGFEAIGVGGKKKTFAQAVEAACQRTGGKLDPGLWVALRRAVAEQRVEALLPATVADVRALLTSAMPPTTSRTSSSSAVLTSSEALLLPLMLLSFSTPRRSSADQLSIARWELLQSASRRAASTKEQP